MGVLDIVKGLTGKKDGSAALIDPKAGYRTDDQEKAIFYFSDENKQGCLASAKGCFKKKEKKGGCFPKKVKGKGCFAKKKFKFVSDAEYDALIQSIVQRLDPKARGLQKLGLDESQVEKVISFANFKYEQGTNDSFYWKFGEDGCFRSSIYEVTYLFFTRDEILAYQLTLSSDWEQHDEATSEYYYKDITAFTTETVQQDVIEDVKGEETKVYKTVKHEFQIVVPNDRFSVVLGTKPTQEEDDAIQGMKSLLREKKS